jgi:DNA invertase Pin-like site-specific DNA recombinase
MKTDLEIFTPFAKKSKFAERLDGKNCIIYTRVSSKEQERGYSLETQKRTIEETCEKSGFTILAYFGGVYESAKTDERTEFNRMLKFARNSKEKVSHIMVYSVDRFSRSGANAIYIASELRKENIKIFAVTQPSDTFTATGKMQQNMQFIFSEYDNDLRTEKCKSGMKGMLMEGYWCTKAPLGYTQITRRKRDNTNMPEKQIIKVNEKGLLIRKAFYWKAKDRLPNMEILKRLKSYGLTIRLQRLTEILSNPFYCGILSHNLLEGEVIEGRHEKLVSKEIFLEANAIKSRNSTWKHNTDFEDIPLKHFVKCSVCQTPFVGYMVKKKGLWYYKCNKTGCKCNRSAKKMNELFTEKLKEYELRVEKYAEPVKDDFFKFFDEIEKDNGNALSILKKHLTEVENKIEDLEEQNAIGKTERETYLKFKGKFNKERLDIRKQMDLLSVGKSNLIKQLENYCKLLSNLNKVWGLNEYRGKLELQELLFPLGIVYDREKDCYRTNETNDIAFAFTGLTGDSAKKDKGELGFLHLNSPSVPGIGLEPIRPQWTPRFQSGRVSQFPLSKYSIYFLLFIFFSLTSSFLAMISVSNPFFAFNS